MRLSTERFLTTHTGSLPRPDDLIHRCMPRRRRADRPRGARGARASAVAEVVKKQAGGRH